MLSESIPTAKFIAKDLGYYPGDPLLAHRCDFTVAAFWDANNALFDAMQVSPEEAKSAAIDKVVMTTFPAFMDKIEPGLGKMTWLAGEKLSVADFWVGAWMCDCVMNDKHPMSGKFKMLLKKYPNISRWGAAFYWENSLHMSMRDNTQPY